MKWTARDWGVMVWGTVTAVVSIVLSAFVIIAGCYLDQKGQFTDGTPHLIAGWYFALKDQATLIGAMVGFSALAWAHFYHAGGKK
ncbi:MAG: hypothetical protein M3O30_02205 [Planctomycetota bacterium]|nr:hypothetical protein [Planctomycetota bacterium]